MHNRTFILYPSVKDIYCNATKCLSQIFESIKRHIHAKNTIFKFITNIVNCAEIK